MNTTGPKVYLVVLNYNNWNDTIDCLNSIQKLNYNNFGIILCDNKSTNNSEAQLLTYANEYFNTSVFDFNGISFSPRQSNCLIGNEKTSLCYIQTNNNKGYAYGNNIGIRFLYDQKLSFQFVWLLNNDALPSSDSLNALVGKGLQDEKVGLYGSTIIDSTTNMVQCLGGSRYLAWTGRMKPLYGGISQAELTRRLETRDPPQIYCVDGAAIFVRKSFIDEVGLMYEKYFLFFEEADWCIRGRACGFKIDVAPASTVIHKGGASTQHSLFSQYFLCRNHFIHLNRYAGWRKYYLIPAVGLIKIFKYSTKNKLEGAKMVARALYDALKFID